MSDRASKPPRRIACVRCRRTKKKCDHAVPVCGQCRRAGVECRQLRPAQTHGEYVTIPLSQYQRLEAGMNGGDDAAHAFAPSPPGRSLDDRNSRPWAMGGVPGVPPTPPSAGGQNQVPTPEWDPSLSSSYPGLLSINSLSGVTDAGSAARLHQIWPSQIMSDEDDAVLQNLTANDSAISAVMADDSGTLSQKFETDPSLDMTWSMELYANVYLAHIQKMYPFLCDDSVRGWMRTCARGQKLDGPHKGFILRLLCAVGAFMCSSFSEDCSHFKEAARLSAEAFDKFYSASMQQEPHIRAQVCLLKLIHAIYGPHPQRIHKALASALRECATILDGESRSQSGQSSSTRANTREEDADADDMKERTRQILLACHQLYEIIASGWDRPEELPHSLDDKLSIHSDRLLASRHQGARYLRHFHKLRRIQHKIRLFHDAAERWGIDREAKNKWKADIVQDVEDWKASLNQGDDEEGHYAPSGKNYTQKVYDYTICLLHEADPSSMVIEDIYALLAASSDACTKFRATQTSNKGIILKNWNALVMQFKVGTLLLYCFWATPVTLRTVAYDKAKEAVDDCSDTLLRFAKRWPSAHVFHETFMCLAAQTPFEGDGPWQVPPDEAAKLELLAAKLRGMRTHKSVLSIIETVIRWPGEQADNDADMFMASSGLDPMNLFELGQGIFGSELLSFDM